jgi:hypothetical protein
LLFRKAGIIRDTRKVGNGHCRENADGGNDDYQFGKGKSDLRDVTLKLASIHDYLLSACSAVG